MVHKRARKLMRILDVLVNVPIVCWGQIYIVIHHAGRAFMAEFTKGKV